MIYKSITGVLIFLYATSAYSLDVFTAENTIWFTMFILFPIPLFLIGFTAPREIKFPIFLASMLGLPAVAYFIRQMIGIFDDSPCRFFWNSGELNSRQSIVLLVSMSVIVILVQIFVILLPRVKLNNTTRTSRNQVELSLVFLLGIGLLINIDSQLVHIANAICMPWLGLRHYFISMSGIQSVIFDSFTIITSLSILTNWRIVWLRNLMILNVLINMPLPIFVLLTKDTSVKVQFDWWLYFIPLLMQIGLLIINRIRIKRMSTI